jgi:pantetheine-phosphate adenylyltransferase
LLVGEELISEDIIDFMQPYLKIAEEYGLSSSGKKLTLEAWNEPHRYWHNLEIHLMPLLADITKNKDSFTDDEYKALIMVSLFHDIVYNPLRRDNEELSAKVFQQLCSNINAPLYHLIVDTIIETRPTMQRTSEISEIFREFDAAILRIPNHFRTLIDYEHRIFKEYQYVDYRVYQEKRILFLENWKKKHSKDRTEYNINQLIDYVKAREPKIGVFIGSFDPFHIGHINVVKKAEEIFDKVIITVLINPGKSDQDSFKERIDRVKKALPFHQVVGYTGLTTDFLKSLDYPVTVVRGIRNNLDLASEIALQRLFSDLFPKFNAIHILTDREYQHISSTMVRNISQIRPGSEGIYLVKPSKNILDKLSINY